MKKLTYLLICLMFCHVVFARDYTKIQEKEMLQTQKYVMNVNNAHYSDTHNTKGLLGDYEEIDDKLYQEKLKQDEAEYAKIKAKFETRTIDNYNAEAKGEDYYHIYRIVEKIIRANKLDYVNWRVEIYRSSSDPIAGYTDWNCISMPTSLYDTFVGNDDAIAFAIAHVIAHATLGHQQRRGKLEHKINIISHCDITGLVYATMYRKNIIQEKNIEFAADIEALNLIANAGYDLKNAMEYLYYLAPDTNHGDFWSERPNILKRISNCETAIKFIPTEKFKEWGEYNIYTTDVLKAELSSDRASFTMIKPSARPKDQYYHPETPQEYYLRCGYGGYINGYYEKSCEYFEKYFKLDSNNSQAYYYASLANEQMYKNTHKNIYRTRAQNYAQKSDSLVPTKL